MKLRFARRALSALVSAVMAMGVFALGPSVEINAAQTSLTAPVLYNVADFNEHWTTHGSNNRSGIPVGTGELGALVWTQADGTLRIQLSSADSWDAMARSIKLTNMIVRVDPNPFTATTPIRQELHYNAARTFITAGGGTSGVPEFRFEIWGNANEPTIHIEASAPEGFDISIEQSGWRTDRLVPSTTGAGGYGNHDYAHVGERRSDNRGWGVNQFLVDKNYAPFERADITLEGRTDDIIWYQRNETSVWDLTLENQYINLGPTADQIPDPLTYRTMGGRVRGTNLEVDSSNRRVLRSTAPQTSYRIDITHNTSLPTNVNDWISEVVAKSDAVWAKDINTMKAAHRQYWDDFWNISWQYVTSNNPATAADALRITNNYVRTRYLFAIQGRGENFIEMQGGIFGFEQLNWPDHKNWHSWTLFNQRFTYWSMLQSGDFELMRSFFNILVDAIPANVNRSHAWWGHGGIILPEHMIVGGPWTGCQYGWNRNQNNNRAPQLAGDAPTGYWPRWWVNIDATRYLYAATPEFATMMLHFYNYTQEEEFLRDTLLPFARETITFLNEHWDVDANGIIKMFPLWSGESDQGPNHGLTGNNHGGDGLTNTAHLVASYQAALEGLLALPDSPHITVQDRALWQSVMNKMPVIPVDEATNTIMISEEWRLEDSRTIEPNNQHIYAVFPLKLFGYGMDDYELAFHSYDRRRGRGRASFTSREQAWRHDNLHAAYLGLTDDARRYTSHFLNPSHNRADVRWHGFMHGEPDGWTAVERNAIGMIGGQSMLVHSTGGRVNLLNAWPHEWNAEFRQALPGNNFIEGKHYAATQNNDPYTIFTTEKATPINYRLPWAGGGAQIFQRNLDGTRGNAVPFTVMADFPDMIQFDTVGGRVYEVSRVPAAVEGVELDSAEIIIREGRTHTLTANIIPAFASNKAVVWSSSNDNVATVEDGVVTGIARGTAIITVTTVDGNFMATCEVTVEARPRGEPIAGVPVVEMNTVAAAGGTKAFSGVHAVQVTWDNAVMEEKTITGQSPAALADPNRTFYRIMKPGPGDTWVPALQTEAVIDRTEGLVLVTQPGTYRVEAFANTTAPVFAGTSHAPVFTPGEVLKSVILTFDDFEAPIQRLTRIGAGNGTFTRSGGSDVQATGVFSDAFNNGTTGNNYEHNADTAWIGWNFPEPTVVNVLAFVPRTGVNANRTYMGRLQARKSASDPWVDLFTNSAPPVYMNSNAVPVAAVLQEWHVKAINPENEAYLQYRWLGWQASGVPAGTVGTTLMNGAEGSGNNGRSRGNIAELAFFYHEYLDATINLPSTVTMDAGDEVVFNSGAGVTWTSSDTTVAAVDNGTIEAVAPGYAIIRAIDGDDNDEVLAVSLVYVRPSADSPIGIRYDLVRTLGTSVRGPQNPTIAASFINTVGNPTVGNGPYWESTATVPVTGDWFTIDIDVPMSGRYQVDYVWRHGATRATVQHYLGLMKDIGRNSTVPADEFKVGEPLVMGRPTAPAANMANTPVLRNALVMAAPTTANNAVWQTVGEIDLEVGINTLKSIVTAVPSGAPNSAVAVVGVVLTPVVVDKVDKTALQASYDANRDRVNDNYTTASWDEFTSALTAAKAVLDDASATQAQVDSAITALQAAIDGLRKQYTVTFDYNDGSEVVTVIVVQGDTVARPDEPAMEGYTFEGWTLNGDEFDFGTAIAQDITLVAEWKLIPVTSLRINAAIIETVARGWRYNFGVILNEGAIDKNVVWTISHPGLAFVDEAGNVTIFERTGTVVLVATDTVSNISHSVMLRITS